MGYVIIVAGCVSESEKKNKDSGHKVVGESVTLDSNFVNNKDKSALDIIVHTYADSINDIASTNQAPLFLEETQLDYEHTGILSSFHDPLSLRKLIFDQVTNCTSLNLILLDKSGTYKKKPKKQHDINVDFIDLSVYDLAQRRYKELDCK